MAFRQFVDVSRFQTLPERFSAKIAVAESGCWEWQASRDRDGYGKFGLRRGKRARWVRAHRYSYEMLVGPIPDGLTIDHLCRVRHCVNPAHLEPVTMWENNRRGESLSAQAARRDACPHGHPLDGTRKQRGGQVNRYCLTCNRQRQAQVRMRRKATSSA